MANYAVQMAGQLLRTFPEGTAMAAWKSTNVPQNEVDRLTDTRPTASPDETATVTSGVVTLTTITDSTEYVVGTASGTWHYFRVLTDTP